MVTYVAGDIFHSPTQVLTNTVNTVGVMGKGIAKEFKRIYPDMFTRYRDLCEQGKLDIGNLWLFKTKNKWILNFPTKKDWRKPSRPEYIEAGLKRFGNIYSVAGIHSIAFPALGCGNGELDFKTQVNPLMEKYLSNLPIDVFIYTGRKDPYPPEHRTPKEIKDWLRSEPEILSFKEVWHDLCNVLPEEKSYRTLSKQSCFIASLDRELKIITVKTTSRHYHYSYDRLLDFWQQLRRYGFTVRRFAPNGLERSTSYLVPIFSELKYIKIAAITDNFDRLKTNPYIGLQFMPIANGQREQPTLF